MAGEGRALDQERGDGIYAPERGSSVYVEIRVLKLDPRYQPEGIDDIATQKEGTQVTTLDIRLVALVLAIGLSGGSGVVVAQQGGQGGQGSGQQRDQSQSGQQAGRAEQQLDRDRDVDRTRDQDRTRTRDQLHLADQQQLRDQDIYGSALMSTAEREQYRQRLQTVQTDAEWAQLRAQHQEQMQARARAQNANIDPPIYGQHMLTTQEQARYREQLRTAQNEQARIKVRTEQQEGLRMRARELGVDVPQPLYGQQLMTEQEQERLRQRLQAATSDQERQRVENEHRQQMQARAREHQIPLDELEAE